MAKSYAVLQASLIAIALLAVSPMISCQENETNFITIDDMKSLIGWDVIRDNNSIIEPSIDLNGIKISYNLPKNNSWVDIYKHIDFAKVPEIEKILFQFSGNGAPNTLELKLVYEDGSNFGYARNMATNSSGIVSLNPWQITYWWGGNSRPRGEPVDFAEVKEMHFAISNKPDQKDTPGEGYIIISGVMGEKKHSEQLEQTIFQKNKEIIVATITGLFGLAMGMLAARGKK